MKNPISIFVVAITFVLLGCSERARLSTQSPEALRLYEHGVSLFERFYYNEARAAFDSSLAMDSSFAMAWARLAILNSSLRNDSAAHVDIGNAMSLAIHATQRERMFISMWNHHLRYEYDAAGRVADSLLQLYPDEREVYLFRGMQYANSKKYDAAIEMYRKAVEADTDYAQAVMMLGYAYSEAGDHENALRQMERYIRLAPDAADPRASYADLLMRVGRYGDALEQYQKSLELKRDYWYSIRSIGMVYLVMGRLKDAEQQFHRASPYPPQSPQSRSSDLATDAYIEVLRGKYSDALDLYRQAHAIDTANRSGVFGMAGVLGKLKKFEEANWVVETIRHDLERRHLLESPMMREFYLMIARLRTDEGRLDEALVACDSALDFSTPLTRGTVYRQLAEIYLRQKSYDSSIGACEEALKVNPNEPEALLTLTKVYAATGDKAMEREIGDRLLALWKDADADYQHAAELRRILGVLRPAT